MATRFSTRSGWPALTEIISLFWVNTRITSLRNGLSMASGAGAEAQPMNATAAPKTASARHGTVCIFQTIFTPFQPIQNGQLPAL
jgi:hypothetical protein